MTPDPITKLQSPSCSIVTFGCRVNQADSLAIEAELRARGAEIAAPDAAGLIIVNTCSVTATADQGARQVIRRLSRTNPNASIVVTGCYATRRPAEVAALPNVARVVTNGDKDRIVSLLADEKLLLTTAERYAGGDGACGAMGTPGMAGRTAITLRVQTGCGERCSYCIIPTTRGVSRSRPLAGVLADVKLAIDAGYKEIVLTGVHLGSYGRDLQEPLSLVALVRSLSALQDDVLFRISSLEPMDCTSELVELVESSSRLAPHFHLPLQHGSDVMLAAMRRPYTAAFYERLVDDIRARLPNASIGSDLIVGFPGETVAQFEETHRLVSRLPLTHLHVFPYSDRPGTEASAMADKVEGVEIRARGQALRDVGHELSRRFRASNVGRSMRALTVDDGWSAMTPNYLKVKLDRQIARNEWVDVRIKSAEPLSACVDSGTGLQASGFEPR